MDLLISGKFQVIAEKSFWSNFKEIKITDLRKKVYIYLYVCMYVYMIYELLYL